MKKLALIGSTGSIGRQTLEVAEFLRDEIEVYGLTAHQRYDLLIEQVRKFQPQCVVLSNPVNFAKLSSELNGWQGRLLIGPEGLIELATDPAVDLVVSAAVGVAGLIPTMAAVKAGKEVALANKETLVVAGGIIMEEVKKRNVRLLPVDSEHNAIFQCLMGQNPAELKYIYLTASGGPFREASPAQMERVSPEDALAHPTWKMGGKITIDSATLMNKGLEVIEAHWLFGVNYDRIKVVIHPQSIVHSLIEMVDGSLLAQLGPADMRLPIEFALTYPQRRNNPFSRLDLLACGRLEFFPPDFHRFPCLELAYEAGRTGGSMPAVMNAANEEAVNLFLKGIIGFMDIPRMVDAVMGEHHKDGILTGPSLEAIMEVDGWARDRVKSRIGNKKGR